MTSSSLPDKTDSHEPRQSGSWLGAALRFLVTWAAYAVTGYLALALAIPPGYASPLYPSAGIGMACVLAWGWRVAPAVALGAFTVNATLNTDRQLGGFVWLWLPTVIGVGAALQAAAGAALVRRWLRQPLLLEEPRDVLRFMVLGGALACVVSSSLATLALGLTGTVPTSQLAFTWWTWWAGDTLGVLVAAPVVLTLIGTPREAWHRRRQTVALPLVAATLLTAIGIMQVGRWDRERLEANFTRDAANAVQTVASQLQGHLDALEALYGVFVASHDMTRDEFRLASGSWLARLPSLQGLGWHERVATADIPAFEERVRAEGLPDYRVFDRSGSTVPRSDEVIAMRFIEPLQGNAPALGVNALSVDAARVAIYQARSSGTAVASAGFRLTQESADQIGVAVYKAVLTTGNPNTAPDRSSATRGTVFVTLRMSDTLRAMRANLPSYLDLCILDTSGGNPGILLAGGRECEHGTASREQLSHSATLPFAGRQWLVRVQAPSTSSALGPPWNAWLFSVVGLLATAMLGALLLTMTGRTRRIEAAVRQRTLELEQEVDAHVRTVTALSASEQRFRDIFNSIPIAVRYTDRKGHILQANAAYCQLTGYSQEELQALEISTVAQPENRDHAVALLDQMRQTPGLAVVRQGHYVNRHGESRWVRTTARLLGDPESPEARTVGVVEDITEHVQLEDLTRAREAAEAASAAKSEFVSRMSHELRTPLNAMLGFAQLLQLDRQPQLSTTQHGWVEQIEQAGWYLLNMINDMLDLSRIESGTLRLEPRPLDLASLLPAAYSIVENDAAKRRITLHEAAANRACMVLGDETRVKQILINLLSNAVKYNVDGGRILVAVELADATRVEITISDTGTGLNAEQMSHLFEPFNRLGQEKSSIEGTGIGLVISRRLAEMMGGSLRASSVEGEGASFVLSLPLAVDIDLTDEAIADTVPDRPRYSRRVVHYIEDNETNAVVMSGMFAQRPQITLEVSATATQGLDAVRRQAPDLLLLDMHLPDLHGMEVLRQLKADPHTAAIPVVVVSADAMHAAIDEALAAGAIRYLTKPVNLAEMLAALDELLYLDLENDVTSPRSGTVP